MAKNSVFEALIEGLKADFDEATVNRILESMVRHAGGERPYIPVKFERMEIAPTETPKSLQKKYRVSKSTSYRWLGRFRV